MLPRGAGDGAWRVTRETGGPAFPNGLGVPVPSLGMSLRDYFAGQWMTTFVIGESGISTVDIATAAYAVADAMLAEREKSNTERGA